MTLKEIENNCLRVYELFSRADENGELDAETSAELDAIFSLGDPNEDRELKLQSYLWVINNYQTNIDACDNMISELNNRKNSFIKKKEYIEKSIFNNLKKLEQATGSSKVVTKTGVPISIKKSGKRPICYDLLEMKLKNKYEVREDFLRKKEVIELDKEKIRAIMEDSYDPDSEESNSKAALELGVWFLPQKETLSIGKTRERKNEDLGK